VPAESASSRNPSTQPHTSWTPRPPLCRTAPAAAAAWVTRNSSQQTRPGHRPSSLVPVPPAHEEGACGSSRMPSIHPTSSSTRRKQSWAPRPRSLCREAPVPVLPAPAEGARASWRTRSSSTSTRRRTWSKRWAGAYTRPLLSSTLTVSDTRTHPNHPLIPPYTPLHPLTTLKHPLTPPYTTSEPPPIP